MSIIKYKEFDVTITFEGNVEGGIPKDPSIMKTWLETKGISGAETYQETLAAMEAPVSDEDKDKVEETIVQKNWSGFKKHPEGGLYIEGRQLKAAFKEAANVTKEFLSKANKQLKQARARLAERVFVWGTDIEGSKEIILLGKHEPDGTDERVVHAQTRKGKISSIKRTDYVTAPTIKFRLEVLDDKLFTLEILTELLEYMGKNGLGANRSQGAGVFYLNEIVEVEHAA